MKIHLVNATGHIQANSLTSLAIGTGDKTFTLTRNVRFYPGMVLLISGDDSNFMVATVTSYTKDTMKLLVNVTSVTGSGTFADWQIDGDYVFRFSSKRGFRTRPTETPARAIWLNRLLEPGSFRVSLYSPGLIGGRSEIGSGVIEVDNTDGVLDDLKYVAFDGRALEILYGEHDAAYPSGFMTLFTGTMQTSELEYNKIRFLLRDRQAEIFSKRMQGVRSGITDNVYVGDGGVSTVEGGADLKGKPKPVCLGTVYNISPPNVNDGKYIYQVNWRLVQSIPAVYSGGNALTSGVARASLAALIANVPSAGQFDYYLGSSTEGAYFRLATDLQTQITCDVVEGGAAGNRTVAQLLKKLLTDHGEIDAGDISSADVTALDLDNDSVVGVWIGTEEREVGSVADEIAQSIGAYLTLDRLGVWRMGQIKAPADGTPAATIKAWQVKNNGQKVQRIAPNDDSQGIIPYEIKVEYKKNYTVQTAADLVAAAVSRVNFTENEYRTTDPSTGAGVQGKHPLSRSRTFRTLLTDSADATAFADNRRDLFCDVNAEPETVAVTLDFENAPVLNLNDVVTLDVPRYNWNGGKDFRLIGIDSQYRRNEVTFTLWG